MQPDVATGWQGHKAWRLNAHTQHTTSKITHREPGPNAHNTRVIKKKAHYYTNMYVYVYTCIYVHSEN